MSGWQALNHPVAAVVLALAVVAALVLFVCAALIALGVCVVGYAVRGGYRAVQQRRPSRR